MSKGDVRTSVFAPCASTRCLWLVPVLLGLWTCAPMAHAGGAAAEAPAVEFIAAFLQGAQGQAVDIKRFAKGNPVLPGDYLVDLDVNDRWVGRIKTSFVARPGSDIAEACLDRALLVKIGLNFSALEAPARAALAGLNPDDCADLPGWVKDATVQFDQSALRLAISLPQAMLQRQARGYVSPEFWERGVPSATLAYNSNVFYSESLGTTRTSLYAGLTAGLNLDDWHFRQRASVSGTDKDLRFQNTASYLLHELPALQSKLVIGDAFSDGAVFNSVGFRGVSLSSDDRMLPASQRGYAPVVRGIARTNANVRITQNGNLLLTTTVAPGPFEIDDLYPTGYGGDLNVTVLEANGSQQSFTVTYASLAQLLRPDVWRYSLAGGEYRNGQISAGEYFAQGAVQYGFSNLFTGFAGGILATGYRSVLAGGAFNTELGAMALDLTVAKADIPGVTTDGGYSLRASYSKLVPDTQTNVSLAAYRYSSVGFWSLEDTMQARQLAAQDAPATAVNRQRSRLQLSINQSLGAYWGSLYLSGLTTSYWNQPGTTTQVQLSYNNSITIAGLKPSYAVSYSRQRDDISGQADKRLLFTLSFPLGPEPGASRVSASMSQRELGGQGAAGGQVSLSGTLGEDKAYSYSANLANDRNSNSVSVSGGYQGAFANWSASASKGQAFTQTSLGVSGGLVVHPGGVTFANQLGDTIGIVEARDAKGAKIASGQGITVDGKGYAVLPNLVPYHINEVSIDPDGIPLDVELKSTRQQVVPRADSVVMVKFETVSGRAVMMAARLPDGSAAPFGASVFDDNQAEVGLVGQDGQMFLRGIPETGRLWVKWGEASDSQCAFDYALPPKAQGYGDGDILRLSAICRTDLVAAMKQPRRDKIAALSVQK
ncbi:MAG: fimbria/pilus outer membrane usher protein [Limnohabitans sp.]